ncbi:MAG: hypothetical protein ACFHWX_01370 [Bacteroidota bacterium]
MEDKHCLECGIEFFGRADKKFCTDSCRNSYNNRLNSGHSSYIKEVNRTLRQNHNILKKLNKNGKTRIHRDKLLMEGFDLDYFTNTYVTKDDRSYHFCYDQGYLILDEGYVLLVKREVED